MVLNSAVDCTPLPELDATEDVFGNTIVTATFAEPAAELRISSDVIVEQSAPAWPVFRIAPRAHVYPFAYAEDEQIDLGALLYPSHPDPHGRLSDWARGFVLGARTDTLSLLNDINGGLLDSVGYRMRDEAGTQSPLETLDQASGSCRDIASLFIETVRSLGFAARAVSGYLFDAEAKLDEVSSTHAWAEVYLPGSGWISFDPTHRRLGSANLIPVAVGRHNEQIMPVTGGYVGAAGDFVAMDVQVSVLPLDRPPGSDPGMHS
jgi:transglutaminase-like putative cysteine protease